MNWSTSKLVLLLISLAFPFSETSTSCAQLINQHSVTLNSGGIFGQTDTSLAELRRIASLANKIGITGRWIVRTVKNDGELSLAQIGQQPNDVISIVPGGNDAGRINIS